MEISLLLIRPADQLGTFREAVNARYRLWRRFGRQQTKPGVACGALINKNVGHLRHPDRAALLHENSAALLALDSLFSRRPRASIPVDSRLDGIAGTPFSETP
jgi:hypothetical protein